MYQKAIDSLKKCFEHLSIIRLPKEEWDEKSEFKKGIARIRKSGGTRYAVVSFKKEVLKRPYVVYDPDPIAGSVLKIEKILLMPESEDYYDLQREDIENENQLLYGNYETVEEYEKASKEQWENKLSSMGVKKSDIVKPVIEDPKLKENPTTFTEIKINIPAKSNKESEWVLDSITNEEEAREYLKEKGVRGVHLMKDVEKIKESILKTINE